MEIKVITKSVRDRLDSFVNRNQEPIQKIQEEPINITEPTEVKSKKIVKRNDGLIERLDSKVFITEDNRQLLND